MARVAIIGGGAIGLASAHYLQSGGHSVTILDANGPASGASYGNAGNFATYACIPVNHPSVFGNLHRYLLSAHSPLRLRLRHMPFMTKWLLAFLRHSRSSRSLDATMGLARLLTLATGGFTPLLDRVGRDLVAEREPLLLFGSPRGLQAAREGLELRRGLGIPFQLLGPDDIRAREPALQSIFAGGVLFTGAWHLRSPYLFLKRLADSLSGAGVAVARERVLSIRPGLGHVSLSLGSGEAAVFDKVVIAAGAYSKTLAAQCGDTVPLDTERGYHLTFPGADRLVSRPCGWSERGLYMTPMVDGLRVAGTVELGGLSPSQSTSLTSLLARSAREALPMLDGPSTSWLGFRPSMPDGLPVLGLSKMSDRVVYAFGHQHLGLTLAGITGRIVAALIDGAPAPVNLAPYSPGRF